ncbi:hypothetical protein ACEU6E_07110 [Halorutilales archaeon Cl-col2-1]
MTLEDIKRRLHSKDVAFIHDPVGNVHFWKLRSVPALQYIGLSDFTYPTSWRQLKKSSEYDKGGRQYEFPDVGYHVIGDENFKHPSEEDLGVVTTSYYEHQTKYSITRLIDRYTASNGTLVVVSDHRMFEPTEGHRPLRHEQFVNSIGAYERVYKSIEEDYRQKGWQLLLQDTKNLFLQDNANLYKLVEGKRVEETRDLFEILPDNPYLPLYHVFCDIFDNPKSQGSGPLETDEKVEALGGWLRRRIEWDRKESVSMARKLNRAALKDVPTFDYAYAVNDSSKIDAREAAEDLNPERSKIDAKYYKWLNYDYE